MKIYLYFVCFLFIVLEQCSCSSDLYEEAKNITAIKRNRHINLWKTYNVPPSDYYFSFGDQLQPPSLENLQADVLLEYQRLVKQNGTCNTKTFQDCVDEYSSEIPLDDRCQIPKTPCNVSEKYSRIGGSCNNLYVPTLGSAHTPYSQWITPVYADGISKIRLDLPNARVMGNMMANGSEFESGRLECGDQINNLLGIMFSQEVAHDISNRRVVTFAGNRSSPMRCCNSENTGPLQPDQINPACVPITFPNDDPFYASKRIFCQEYNRMQTTLENNCKVHFNAENKNSHFLDLSPIYSEDENTLKTLRANISGLFNLDATNVFPVDQNGQYKSAEIRNTQTTVLSLVISLFFRMHNVMARNLQELNPNWTNDETFFESRRLNMATYQHIVYNEWLPLVMDKNLLKARKLNCGDESNPCDVYNSTIDPSSMVEFANGAFKFFHINVPEKIHVADASFNVTKKINFQDAYTVIAPLKDEFNDYLRGIMGQEQRMYQLAYPNGIRDYFLPSQYRGSLVGVDGFNLNMMRSRDNGMAPFVNFTSRCFSKNIQSWDDLQPYFEPKHFQLLQTIYSDFNDIDLYAAIFFEKRCGHFAGKISSCVMAEQFYRYRYGDRFFYSNSQGPHPFTPEQIKEIERMTYAKLICMSTTLETVAGQSFVTISEKNPVVRCSDLGHFNFELFKQS